jgi:hypothetical protein
MSIDTSGKWWVGSDPEDLGAYLEAYSDDGYKSTEFRLSRCECGSLEFQLDADDEEGVACRTCAKCGAVHYICESEEFWSEASPQRWRCIECGSERANVGVGYALYADDPTGVKWVYIGERCVHCGVLGCFAGWKVGESDALRLLDKA